MHPSRSLWIWGLASLLLLSFGLVAAAGRGGHSSSPPADAAPAAPGTAALRVAIDPESGTLVPAPPSLDAKADVDLQTMLSRSSEGLTKVVHPDGHVSVLLEGRFQNAAVARIGDGGKVETACVERPEDAEAFRRGDTASQTPQTPEER
jgi:hypothetical protein